MELAALRADSSESDVSSVVDTLRLTISHARSVQDEMKRLTSGDSVLGRLTAPQPRPEEPADGGQPSTDRR
jgi:hypothetical protein